MKEKLRAQKMLERLDHHPVEKSRKDEAICGYIEKLPEFQKARTVLFYASIKGEVELKSLFLKYGHQKNFVLPRVKNHELELYHVSDWSDTEVGAFQILEPKIHLRKVVFLEVDLALIPGLAFSDDGHRIGYGRGFYDRLLKELHCFKIGIAYEFQKVKNISGEVHDVKMDMIVTEVSQLRIKN